MRMYLARITLFGLLFAAACGLAAAGCHDSSSHGAATAQPATEGAATLGNWATIVTHNTQNLPLGDGGGLCGDAPFDNVFTLVIADAGGQISLTSSDGEVNATGSINGSTMTFTYSFPDGKGTTTSSVTLVFGSSTGDSTTFDFFTGDASYTFQDPMGFSCTGTDGWQGNRIPEVPTGEGLTGSWLLTITILKSTCEGDAVNDEETFPVTVSQKGDEVTITVPLVGDISGTVSKDGNQMSIFAEFIDEEFTAVFTGQVDIASDQNTVSGPLNVSITDANLDDGDSSCSAIVEMHMKRVMTSS